MSPPPTRDIQFCVCAWPLLRYRRDTGDGASRQNVRTANPMIYLLCQSARSRLPSFAIALLIALVLFSALAPTAQAQACVPLPPFATEADRIGFNVETDEGENVFAYDTDYFGAGWFTDYRPTQFAGADYGPVSPTISSDDNASNSVLLPLMFAVHPNMHSMAYLHLIRTGDLDGNWRILVRNLVSRYPGLVLVVGNEPDRPGLQDDLTPAQYATIYHDVYAFAKQVDPTVQIAIAGIVQPTPLRREYLNRVLDAYLNQYGQQMPIDVWTIHAFILREADPVVDTDPFENWGAGIPRGLEDRTDLAIRYNVNQHGDINIFKENIVEFRKWMRDRGYRSTPLIVTEYGILMRPDYRAPDDPLTGEERVYDHDFVRGFMFDTFDFFRTATSPEFGNPADGNRLVQSWSWFALNNIVDADNSGCCNGNLLNHDSGVVTPLGQDFAAYTASYGANTDYTDLNVRSVAVEPKQVFANTSNQRLAVNYAITNRGNVRASGARLRFWLGEPGSGTLLAGQPVSVWLSPRCREQVDGQVTVTLPILSAGAHTLTVQVLAAEGANTSEALSANNSLSVSFQAVPVLDGQSP